MSQKDSVAFMCRLINETINKKVNQKLKPFGLAQSQGRVLAFLRGRMGQKTTQKDIETFFEVSHPTVVGILKRLEANGFIRCETDERDRRMKNVFLTQKEFEVHAEMKEFHDSIEMSLLTGLSEEYKKELLRLLRSVYENIR